MPQHIWWKEAVFYEIYPRSFADSNGDGIGDLPGIIQHLDYLAELGINAIWLQPHYPSPQVDVGYDVADYCAVAHEYGTLEDFKRLLEGCHRRGIRLVTDFVLNHTSPQHPWFLESRSSRTNPKADWYVWRDGKNGGPPNNWLSDFGGSAWEYVPERDQYYYHFFFKEQPDLNWRNPQVKQAMFDAMRFWLDLGVDGFRLDAMRTLYEDPAMPDQTSEIQGREAPLLCGGAGEDPTWVRTQRRKALEHQWDQPGLHDLLKELRAVMDGYDERMLVGETGDPVYLGNGSNELHMVYGGVPRGTPQEMHAAIPKRWASFPPEGWQNVVLGGSDSARGVPSDNPALDEILARRALALTLTLPGTPMFFEGYEIGMTDLYIEDASRLRDTLALILLKADIARGQSPEEALRVAARRSRDKSRIPMQWTNAPNGGFCPAGVQPWLPVNPDWAQGINVADQDRDPDSRLNYYRRILAARKKAPALAYGEYVPLHTEAADHFAFLRRSAEDRQTCLVVVNLLNAAQCLSFALPGSTLRTLFSSHTRAPVSSPTGVWLAPYEVYMAELS